MKLLVFVIIFLGLFTASVSAQNEVNESVAVIREVDSSASNSVVVNNVEKVSLVKVWPNPTAFKLFVDIEGKQNVEIYSVTGRLVKSVVVEKGQSINVETLIPGKYILKTNGKQAEFIKK